MPLLDNLFGPQLDRIQRAMSRAGERHSLLSQNLANINTPGYKRKDIDFNIVLEDEERQAIARFAGLQSRFGPRSPDQYSLRLDGNNVDLEREVLAIAETELRYEALTDFASAYFNSLRTAIREGR